MNTKDTDEETIPLYRYDFEGLARAVAAACTALAARTAHPYLQPVDAAAAENYRRAAEDWGDIARRIAVRDRAGVVGVLALYGLPLPPEYAGADKLLSSAAHNTLHPDTPDAAEICRGSIRVPLRPSSDGPADDGWVAINSRAIASTFVGKRVIDRKSVV